MMKSPSNVEEKSILNKLKRKNQIAKVLTTTTKKSMSPVTLKDVAYRKLTIITKWKMTLKKFQVLEFL